MRSRTFLAGDRADFSNLYFFAALNKGIEAENENKLSHESEPDGF